MKRGRVFDYLDHMIEAAAQACLYVDGMSKDQFLSDKRTQQAVVLNLILIGEEAAKILKEDESIPERFPHIAWRGMKGMRNRIAHGYFEINLDIVWETTLTALPALIRDLPAVRERLP